MYADHLSGISGYGPLRVPRWGSFSGLGICVLYLDVYGVDDAQQREIYNHERDY